MSNLTDFFQLSSDDQAVALLSRLFGGIGNVPGSPGIMADMFKTFNSIILVVGLFIVVYTVILGLITTAHEGEYLGKKFHGLWTPIRMVIGIASLVPTASGYSGIQIIMMWLIVQGIGAADTMWSGVLNYTLKFGSVFAQSPTLGVGIAPTMQGIFASLTCSAAMSMPANSVQPSVIGVWQISNPKFVGYNGTGTNQLVQQCSGTTCTLAFGPNGVCGTLTYSNPSGPLQTANQQAVNMAQSVFLVGTEFSNPSVDINNTITLTPKLGASSLIDKLYLLAYSFVLADTQYLNFYSVSPNNPANRCTVQGICYDGRGVYMGYIGNPSQGSVWGWLSENYCRIKPVTPCCRGYLGSACSGANGNNPSDFPNPDQNTDVPTDINAATANIILNAIIKPIAEAAPSLWQSTSTLTATANTNATNAATTAASVTLGSTLLTPDQLKALKGSDYINGIMSNLGLLYTQAIQTAADSAAASNPSTVNDSNFQRATATGWIFAGSYYYWLSTINNQNLQDVNPVFTINPGVGTTSPLPNYRNNLAGASSLFNSAAGDSNMTPYTTLVNGAVGSVLDGFMSNITGGTDTNIAGSAVVVNPLVRMQNFGQSLISGAIAGYVLLVITVTWASGAIALASSTAVGIGVPGIWYALQGMVSLIYPAFLALFGIMISIGSLLGIYTPLIPYVVFTTSVIGWFISIIEAMVAAPLVAIGILSPSAQHHELLGKAEPAIMMIFAIILRPTLMVFGLVASMLLAVVALSLINATFATTMLAMNGQTNPAGIVLLFYMAAYLFLVLAVLNKCFSLIAILPGKVMTWISGHAESAETEAQQEIKGAISTAAGKASGAGSGGLESSQKGFAEQKKADQIQAKYNAAHPKGREGGQISKSENPPAPPVSG